jgi:nucleotide-binding universal stress UspA family protein
MVKQQSTALPQPRRDSLRKLHSILVPIDFSKDSETALAYAAEFAQQTGATLTLLHVVEPMAYSELSMMPMLVSSAELHRALRGKLVLFSRRCNIPRTLIGEALVGEGAPFQVINAMASRLSADLIIISMHGLTGMTHSLIGCTAERVVRHAPCPVLVVRNKAASGS